MSQVRGHDKTYEWKATLILSLAFGLVGLDRFILPSLFFGHIDVDLGLNEGHLGQIVGVLAVAWGISAVLFGGLSDRLGRRNVLVPAVIFFSLMSWASGAVTGLVSLLLVRALMGVAEGAVAPTGVAAVVEASHPNRRGINNGFFQCAIALFGLAIAPIMATQLLQYMSWRWVFLIAGIPGLIVALFLWKIIREPHQLATSVAESAAAPKPPLASIFRHRNIVVSMLSLMLQAGLLGSRLVEFWSRHSHKGSDASDLATSSSMGALRFIGKLLLWSVLLLLALDNLGIDVTAAVAGHDVVVNLATAVPTGERANDLAAWDENDRIRGTVDIRGRAQADGGEHLLGGLRVKRAIRLTHGPGQLVAGAAQVLYGHAKVVRIKARVLGRLREGRSIDALRAELAAASGDALSPVVVAAQAERGVGCFELSSHRAPQRARVG